MALEKYIYIATCSNCGILVLVSERYWDNGRTDQTQLNSKGDWVATKEHGYEPVTDRKADVVGFGCPICKGTDYIDPKVVRDRMYDVPTVRKIARLWNHLKKNDVDNNYRYGISLNNDKLKGILFEHFV
jgi:hypothetical protein